jgi:SWI/SNF-related matrix-associated actin-dependent regulator 1 of chromatin subfamily A
MEGSMTETVTNAVDNLQVKIADNQAIELFASYIKDAVVNRVARTEHFNSIRLRSIEIRMLDLFNTRARGLASGNQIEVSEKSGALQLAGTTIHELAHHFVGLAEQHNENFRDGLRFLGLTFREHGQEYHPDDFDHEMLTVVREAIAKFVRENPTLVVNPDADIPWPAHIGLFSCQESHESYGPCSIHKAHVLEYQITGIREMLRRSGNSLLGDEMGLGKTVQVIGYINATKPKRILIACPNNAKLIWKRHIEEWSTESYDYEVAHSNLYMFSDVVIINYEALVKWGDVLKTQEWDLFVCDEAHYLKTPSAKRSKVAYGIRAKKAIFVTGSPIVNYPYEIFPLIHYLDRQNWPEYGRFEAMFGSKSNEKLGRNLNRLNSMLRATILTRREKKHVLTQLPRKRRQIIEFEVPEEVKPLIGEEKKLWQSLQGEAGIEAVNFLNAMRNESETATDDFDWQAIIEALTLTKSYAFSEMAKIAHRIGLAKLPMVIEHIENVIETREKVLVFGHHRDVLTKIAERFAPGSVLLLGGNRDQGMATQQAADRFNNDDSCTVMCAQVSNAQGYSIKGASTVIFVEEDWVPGVMTQAEDRLHGIGRGEVDAKSLMIQHLVFEDSLDTYKAKRTIQKQKSIDRAVGSTAR